MKILLDTNVLIAAFIARGMCSELFEHCLAEHTIMESLTSAITVSLEPMSTARKGFMPVSRPLGLIIRIKMDFWQDDRFKKHQRL